MAPVECGAVVGGYGATWAAMNSWSLVHSNVTCYSISSFTVRSRISKRILWLSSSSSTSPFVKLEADVRAGSEFVVRPHTGERTGAPEGVEESPVSSLSSPSRSLPDSPSLSSSPDVSPSPLRPLRTLSSKS
ncbi:Hypothetical predicted protein [Olea europaea subsp. europaea]|uniref:Uncharacterized protein n=1 Tax=Olea europaea subsp. europaea TaxID=158383 RepID=A0A8S0QIJ2_OLEEU|nr:Hypothetical predicted protein [Olea europaea subsp. europaea]